MKLWKFSAKILVLVSIALIFLSTNNLFTMVQGSDSTSFLITPTKTTQLVCIVIVAIALLVPTRPTLRIFFVIAGVFVTSLGGHRLVIDNLNYKIRDVYLAVTVQSVTLDPAHEGGFVIVPTTGGFHIGPAGTGINLWCFSPPLIGLSQDTLSRAVQKS